MAKHTRKRLYPARTGIGFCLIVCGLILNDDLSADTRAVYTDRIPQAAFVNWMHWVPDSVPLSSLSIPGTHDSMSHYGGPLAQTQSLRLLEQLRAGIREIDIRTRNEHDRFPIYHGPFFQGAGFGDVLTACNSFLEENPSETILLWLSADGVPTPVNFESTRVYYETFKWYRDESGVGQRIYIPTNTLSAQVPLGRIRGKILIIQGFSAPEAYGLYGSSIRSTEFWDIGGPDDMPLKWESILTQAIAIDNGTPENLYQNPLSGSSSSGNLWPIDVANGLLQYEGMSERYLKYLFTGNQRRTTGLISMDFPGSGLIAAIIAHNLKFATNAAATASDLSTIVHEIAYSTTGDGDDEARDRARQLKLFLEHVLPDQHWSVLSGRDSWGLATEARGLTGQSTDVDGFSLFAFANPTLDGPVSNTQLLSYLTPTVLAPLSGDVFTRALGAKNLLKSRFPSARWNVAVKQLPIDVDNWAAELSAVAAVAIPVVDEGSTYLYTAWTTSATNLPPVVKSGGPYVVNEGSPVIFNAGESSDPTGAVLQYRWDLDGDGTWDTPYSYDPTVTIVYANNHSPLSPSVEVFDGATAVTAKISINVLNVAPRLSIPGHLAAGSNHQLIRNFEIIDPGADTWVVDIGYGDGSPSTQLSTSARIIPFSHQFPAPGYFKVTLSVRDGDGGIYETSFRVVTGTPALDLERTGSVQARISWTNHPAPFRLEHMTAPDNAPAWTPVTEAPQLINGRRVVHADATNALELFRLTVP